MIVKGVQVSITLTKYVRGHEDKDVNELNAPDF